MDANSSGHLGRRLIRDGSVGQQRMLRRDGLIPDPVFGGLAAEFVIGLDRSGIAGMMPGAIAFGLKPAPPKRGVPQTQGPVYLHVPQNKQVSLFRSTPISLDILAVFITRRFVGRKCFRAKRVKSTLWEIVPMASAMEPPCLAAGFFGTPPLPARSLTDNGLWSRLWTMAFPPARLMSRIIFPTDNVGTRLAGNS